MKLIIAGSRHLKFSVSGIQDAMDEFKDCGYEFIPSEIVCGGAKGIDYAGKMWAKENGLPVKIFQPDWDRLGKAAGPVRNLEMAQYADGLLLIWDGKSKGSRSMKTIMKKEDKPIFEIIANQSILSEK